MQARGHLCYPDTKGNVTTDPTVAKEWKNMGHKVSHKECNGGSNTDDHTIYCGCAGYGVFTKEERIFKNLTPHPINLIGQDGSITTLPKCDNAPRLSQAILKVDTINGINITESQFGETSNLPEFEEGVFLIVSRMVLSANAERKDLLVPNELVRDSEGNIIGCKSLSRN